MLATTMILARGGLLLGLWRAARPLPPWQALNGRKTHRPPGLCPTWPRF